MSQNTAIKDTAWHEDATSPATQADYRELQAHYDQLQTELLNWRKKSASQAVQIETLAKEVDSANDRAGAIADERDALAAELAALSAFRDEVVGVMSQSQGVAGWHKNHTIATWDELLPNVPDFESPQQHLAEIRAQAGRDAADSLLRLADNFQASSKEFENGVRIAAEYLKTQNADSIRQEKK